VKVNWKSKKFVLGLIAAACFLVFVGGMAAAWHNRNHTVCGKNEIPVAERGGYYVPGEFRCPDGRVVTTPG
jgi:hypothetical protein